VLVRKVTITNPLGIHARPSALIVQTATRFKSEVFFSRGDLRVNGKSIMGVMMLAAEMGSVITIEAEGEDEEECVKALEQAFAVRFDDN
jgi:phosphocarrier protein